MKVTKLRTETLNSEETLLPWKLKVIESFFQELLFKTTWANFGPSLISCNLKYLDRTKSSNVSTSKSSKKVYWKIQVLIKNKELIN